MKKKIILVLLSATIIAGILTGCSSTKNTPNTSNNSDTNTEVDASEGNNNEEDTSVLSEKVEIIKVYMPLVGAGNITDVEKVVLAINNYIEPMIHANIELTYIPYAQWEDQMNLTVASGEQVDLMCTVREISSYYKNGALTPLDNLLENYGQGILECVDGIYLSSTTFAGKIYGVPTLRDMAKQQVFEYDAEMAEKYGLEMKEYMTMDELEEQLYKLEKANPETSGVLLTNSVRTFDSWCGWDGAGDPYGVVMMGQENVELVNLFESEEYISLVTRMEKWFNDGIVNPEAPTNDTQWADVAGSGIIFGRFARSKPGYEVQETLKYGTELKVSNLMEPIADSSQVQFLAWAIPTTSKYPEKAMAFMNLLYTDEHVVNLLSYGIKDEHYKVIDETAGVIDYPDGIDSSTSGYTPGMNYAVGNELIGHIWTGNDPDLWSQLQEFNAKAQASPLLGFAFDNSKVSNEISACNNVLAKYAISLEIGAVDVKTILPEFQQALRDAGIEKIIAEKQAQVDEWYNWNN